MDLANYIRRSVSWTSGGTTYLTYMYEAQRSTRGPYSFERWYTCATCSFDYPESEIVLINGSPYCTRLDDAAEKFAELERGRK